MSAIFVPLVICVCACICVPGGCGPLYVALYWGRKELYGAAWKLMPHQDSGSGCLSTVRETEKKERIYIKFYIVQNIYRPFVPLKSCSALATTSALYHVIIIHRLVLMTRGWFDCFFMSSAFFAINAFVLKNDFHCLCAPACSFMLETRRWSIFVGCYLYLVRIFHLFLTGFILRIVRFTFHPSLITSICSHS